MWSTVPMSAVTLTSGYDRGWLTFECESCLRRLAPIPDGWDGLPEERLEVLCDVARDVPRHTGQAD